MERRVRFSSTAVLNAADIVETAVGAGTFQMMGPHPQTFIPRPTLEQKTGEPPGLPQHRNRYRACEPALRYSPWKQRTGLFLLGALRLFS